MKKEMQSIFSIHRKQFYIVLLSFVVGNPYVLLCCVMVSYQLILPDWFLLIFFVI